MAIPESQISILIPSYGRPEMTRLAVRSALATNAGEVIVSDDASSFDIGELLADFRDARLRIVRQPRNIGLWPNHRALLFLASLPYVKFLQNDDYLTEGGLKHFAEAVGPETTVVSARMTVQRNEAPIAANVDRDAQVCRWRRGEYLRRFIVLGNSELDTPSNTLYLKSALDLREAAWRDELSADFVANVCAAASGEVVTIPPGAVITVDHEGRDTRTQSFAKCFSRLRNTASYLMSTQGPDVQRVMAAYALAEAVGTLRDAVGSIRRGRHVSASYCWQLVDLVRVVAPCVAAGDAAALIYRAAARLAGMGGYMLHVGYLVGCSTCGPQNRPAAH